MIICFDLLNIHSLTNKGHLVHDILVDQKLDVMCLTYVAAAKWLFFTQWRYSPKVCLYHRTPPHRPQGEVSRWSTMRTGTLMSLCMHLMSLSMHHLSQQFVNFQDLLLQLLPLFIDHHNSIRILSLTFLIFFSTPIYTFSLDITPGELYYSHW